MEIICIESTEANYKKVLQTIYNLYPHPHPVDISYQTRLYDNLSVEDNLMFFLGVVSSPYTLENVLQKWNIENILSHKVTDVSRFEYSILKICVAEILSKGQIILWDPLENLNAEEESIIINSIQSNLDTSQLFIISSSFRNITHFPGEDFYFSDNKLIPIAQSIDQNMSETIQVQSLKINIKSGSKTLLVNVQDIQFIESIDGVSHAYIRNEVLPVSSTMDELENRLRSYGFFRCHRSYIVNVQKVSHIDSYTRNSYTIQLMDLKHQLPLSKRRYNEFLENYSTGL